MFAGLLFHQIHNTISDTFLSLTGKMLIKTGFFAIIAVLSFIAVGCDNSPASQATPTSTTIVVPTTTPVPTETPTPRPPTSTPVPTATATKVNPTPTSVPTATATTVPPTSTSVPPTATSVPAASSTSVPPTPTAISPGLTQATLTPSKDNTLYENSGGNTSNGAGEWIFAGKTKNGGLIRRAVMAFDIASAVPAGATIESVTLKLHMSKSRAGPETVKLHRLLGDWGEGASDASANEGGGTNSASGDATWKHRFFSGDDWQTLGGDFTAVASASASVAGVGDYVWSSTSQMVDDVQSWHDDPSTNAGWIVIGNESSDQTAKRFYARENSDTFKRPLLAIAFTTP